MSAKSQDDCLDQLTVPVKAWAACLPVMQTNSFRLCVQPADVQAASYGGAHAIGVCTGVFSPQELIEAAKDNKHGVTILEGLAAQPQFLEAAGLA